MTSGLQSVGKTLSWRWRHFALFSGPEWHRVLELRTAIFVVEQECPYQEVDDKDTNSWHLEVTHEDELIGTCLLYTSPSPRDLSTSRMPSSA